MYVHKEEGAEIVFIQDLWKKRYKIISHYLYLIWYIFYWTLQKIFNNIL